jgi:hypothetical protein
MLLYSVYSNGLAIRGTTEGFVPEDIDGKRSIEDGERAHLSIEMSRAVKDAAK